jgi:hypothetical protein
VENVVLLALREGERAEAATVQCHREAPVKPRKPRKPKLSPAVARERERCAKLLDKDMRVFTRAGAKWARRPGAAASAAELRCSVVAGVLWNLARRIRSGARP